MSTAGYHLIIILPDKIAGSASLCERWKSFVTSIAKREILKRALIETSSGIFEDNSTEYSFPLLIPYINPENCRKIINGEAPAALIYAAVSNAPSAKQAETLRECIAENIPIIPLVFSGGDDELPPILRGYQMIAKHERWSVFLSRVARAVCNAFALSGTSKVFISYSRGCTDKAAQQLFNRLNAQHYATFMDVYSINPPCVFQDKLCEELLTSDVIILLCADEKEESSWMKYEANLAFINDIGIILVKWKETSPRMEHFADKIVFCKDFDDMGEPIFHDNNLSHICNLVDYVSTCAHNRKKITILEKAALETHQTWMMRTGYDHQKAVYSYAVSEETNKIIVPITRIPNLRDFHRAKQTFRDKEFSLACQFTAELHKQELELDWISYSTQIPLTNYHA